MIALLLVTVVPSAVTAHSRTVPSTAALTTQCTGDWSTVAYPTTLAGMEPQAIATVSGEPAWSVGLPSALIKRRVPLFARWTGDGWEKVKSPFNGYGILNGVAASSASAAWAIGAGGSYTRFPIAARWNGTAWVKVAIPAPSLAQGATLTDVALVSSTTLWASGAMLVQGREKPVVARYKGGRWRYFNPQLPADAEGGLTDVSVAAGGRIWAAGWKTDDTGQSRPWVTYRERGIWRSAALDTVATGRAAVTDLSFRAADDGWATGFLETAGGYAPFLQHWNGSTWQTQPLPWAAGNSYLPFAVEAVPKGVALAGMVVDQLRRDFAAMSDDGGWHIVSVSTGSLAEIAAMYDLAPVGDGVVAVGPVLRQPTSLFFCDGVARSPGRSGDATTAPPAGDGAPTMASAAEFDHPNTSATVAATGGLPATVSIPGTVATDVTESAGLGLVMPTWGGVAADFNDDGYEDLFVNRHYAYPPLLYMGSASGTFTPLDAEIETVDRHRCAAADVDQDNTLDLFCGIGDNKGTTNTPDELLLDVADGGGHWASRSYGVMDGFGRARDVAFIDLDGDPFPDLYVANEPSRADALWSSARLFHNVNGEYFEAAPQWGLDHAIGFGVALAADLNDDGVDDLLTDATEPSDGLDAGARAFIHDGSRFVDATLQLGLVMGQLTDTDTGDFNGDGRLDVVQASTSELRVMFGTQAGFEVGYSVALTGAWGLGIGDVNADDVPDIYVARRTTGNADHLMLVNDGDGTSFTSMTIPQPGAGSADDVLAIDYDNNGRTDFALLNGWSFDGPLKLTAFFPSAP